MEHLHLSLEQQRLRLLQAQLRMGQDLGFPPCAAAWIDTRHCVQACAWTRLDSPCSSLEGELSDCHAAQHPAAALRFSFMSTIKPFLYARCLEVHGQEQVSEWVENLGSSTPYYSSAQLVEDGGKPRSPMLNSGAMLLADKLPGGSPAEQMELFLDWLCALAPGVQRPVLDEPQLLDLLVTQSRGENGRIAELLEEHGHIRDRRQMLDSYFRLCCLETRVIDLAALALVLGTSRAPWVPDVLTAMQRCGLYEDSPAWADQGLPPAKSGVSGALFVVHPGEGALAVFCECLDEAAVPWVSLDVALRVERDG